MYQPPSRNQITFSTKPSGPVPMSLWPETISRETISLPNGQKAKPAMRQAAPVYGRPTMVTASRRPPSSQSRPLIQPPRMNQRILRISRIMVVSRAAGTGPA